MECEAHPRQEKSLMKLSFSDLQGLGEWTSSLYQEVNRKIQKNGLPLCKAFIDKAVKPTSAAEFTGAEYKLTYVS